MSKRRVVVKQQKQPPNPMAGVQAAMRQMSQMDDDLPPMPVFPDKSTVVTWSKDRGQGAQVDFSQFITVWPSNIDSTKPLKYGRRVPKESACKEPDINDLHECLVQLRLTHAVEPYRGYPREPWVQGRVRVELVDEDGIPMNPEVPTRKTLMRKMGRVIPGLPGRRSRLQMQREEADKAAREAQEKKAAAAAAAAAPAASGKKKGKGKKGRKG